jgi:23S rRNA pseudouridine2605 synthase
MSKDRKPYKKRRSPKPTVSKQPAEPAKAPESAVGMRLNKYVAHAGICSRRQAAEYVKEGLVTVNGEVELSPGYQVQAGDEIAFKGQLITPEEHLVYILMNKPKNVITTVKDDRGRKTVMDQLQHKIPERIFPVGRLDRDTTGLLLLTNDGKLAEKIMHPRHKMKKIYNVTLERPVEPEDLERIRQGLELEDGLAPVNWAEYLSPKKKSIVALEIQIGRNRIVRRIFEHLNYEVKKLDRIYLGGLTKKDLPRGFWRHLTEREVRMLKHF